MTRGSELESERENAEKKRDNCGASGKLRAWEKERKIVRQGWGKSRRRDREKERERYERRDVEETVGVGWWWRWQSEK